MEEKSQAASGIGFSGALFIVFLVLKLTGVIDWSWWWVTAPLWGPLAAALLFGVVGTVILYWLKARREERFRRRSREGGYL